MINEHLPLKMKNQPVFFNTSIVTIILGLIFNVHVLVTSQEHGHDTAESPVFKYSPEVNVHASLDDNYHDDHDHRYHGHGHDHGYDHHGHSHDFGEQPSFKYSREANAPSHEPVREYRQANEKLKEYNEHQSSHRTTQKTTSLWMNAIGSTLLVSAIPFFILFLIPLDNTDASRPLLKVLLSFAAGGLLGDGFLHLLPHAQMAMSEQSGLGSHGHVHGNKEHSHEHGGHVHDMNAGLWVLSGIVTFLVVEKLVRIIKGDHSHSHIQHEPVGTNISALGGTNASAVVSQTHDKSDSTELSQKGNEKHKSMPSSTSEKAEERDDISGDKKHVTKHIPANLLNRDEDSQQTSSSMHEKGQEMIHQQEIKVAGYLNLAADFIHNLTDGLAIGASYLAGHSIGVVTTMTIVLHEVPHEIGDFAILVQSGVPRQRAIMLQLTTALGALAGTVISLLAEGASAAATSRILGFTAGGFIYIATVTVIPELLERSSLWQSVKELLAMLVGMYMMVLIAEYE